MKIEKFLKELNERQKEVFVYRFILEKTQYEVAEELDMPEIQVSRLETAVINKMFSDMKINTGESDPSISRLKDTIKSLSKIEGNVFVSRYILGKTQDETAKKLNVPQLQVSRIEAKILNKITRNINNIKNDNQDK